MSDQDSKTTSTSSAENTLAAVMIHVHNAIQFNNRGAQEQVSRCLVSAREKIAKHYAEKGKTANEGVTVVNKCAAAVAIHIPKKNRHITDCAILFSCDQHEFPDDESIIKSLRFDFSKGDKLEKFYLLSEENVNVDDLIFVEKKNG